MYVKCYLLLSQLSAIIYSQYSDTSGDTKMIGGLLGGEYDVGENLKQGILDICKWMLNGLFSFLSPFVTYGCKITIVACFIIYVVSGDKVCISRGLKTFIIYLVFLVMREGVLMACGN